MDLSNYKGRKAAGAVQLVKVGHHIVLLTKQFDIGTGKELEPLSQTVNEEDLKKRLKALEENVEHLKAVLADIEEIKTSKKS
jgi:uncharacterized protein (DUF342 family)